MRSKFTIYLLQIIFLLTNSIIQQYVTLNDFGFTPSTLYFISNKQGILPKDKDFYNPTDPWFGNSNLKESYPDGKCKGSDLDGLEDIDWVYANHGKYDLRMAYLKCENGKIVTNIEWGDCKVDLISPVTKRPYCYHTEASSYAQTSMFFAIVAGQFCNYQAVRQLKSAGFFNGFHNPYTLEMGIFLFKFKLQSFWKL